MSWRAPGLDPKRRTTDPVRKSDTRTNHGVRVRRGGEPVSAGVRRRGLGKSCSGSGATPWLPSMTNRVAPAPQAQNGALLSPGREQHPVASVQSTVRMPTIRALRPRVSAHPFAARPAAQTECRTRSPACRRRFGARPSIPSSISAPRSIRNRRRTQACAEGLLAQAGSACRNLLACTRPRRTGLRRTATTAATKAPPNSFIALRRGIGVARIRQSMFWP
jgi:hypothetical protein